MELRHTPLPGERQSVVPHAVEVERQLRESRTFVTMYSRSKQLDNKAKIVKFIKCVEKHPALYDYTMSSYKTDEQEKAWMEVAREMDENASLCKEKWKNLRACLCRHFRMMLSTDPAKAAWKRPYYLAEYMKFVIPFTKYGRADTLAAKQLSRIGVEDGQMPTRIEMCAIKPEPNDNMLIHEDSGDELQISSDPSDYLFEESSLNADADDLSVSEHVKEEVEDPLVTFEGTSCDDQLTTGALRIVQTSRLCKQESIAKTSSITEQKIVLKRKRPEENWRSSTSEYENPAKFMLASVNAMDEDDSDLSFFKSLLSDVHKMNDSQKIKFKLTVLNCINNILYEEPSTTNKSTPDKLMLRE